MQRNYKKKFKRYICFIIMAISSI